MTRSPTQETPCHVHGLVVVFQDVRVLFVSEAVLKAMSGSKSGLVEH